MFMFSFLLIIIFIIIMSVDASFPDARPPVSKRKFHSVAVENEIVRINGLLKDKDLAKVFSNAFPNTVSID
jgi:hypothetical protein